ncbi:DivIVA domain-containing protein [bacterium]|jgi:cell division initiation protein|nr:DivIVA domain-containing protein [bacterium]
MRLTPLEIENMVFPKRKFGGVDEVAVREFLTRVAREQEEFSRDYKRAREELREIRERFGEQASLETALKDALTTANQASGQIRKSAEKESILLLKESELKAENMLDDARLELKGLTDEIRNFKTVKRRLKSELRVILQSYMELLEEDK